MGGDGGIDVTVPAAAAMTARAEVVLVGDRERIHAALPAAAPELTVIHASQVLSPRDSLADVLRRRPDSSMRRALACHAAGHVDAVVSAGDTAALMALARSQLGMVAGIERPAICKDLQGMRGRFWMLDLGANIGCSARQIQQFAHMGVLLARHVGGVARPRVALLNIGTEPGKGPDVLNEAADLLEADPRIDYVGFVEGDGLFADIADVVVSDGFAGNIALKSIEGAARMAMHLVQNWLGSLSVLERAGLLLARSKLAALRHELNPQGYNGASLIGLAGVVVKSHGSAGREGFQQAIEEATLEVAGEIPRRLAEGSADPDPAFSPS